MNNLCVGLFIRQFNHPPTDFNDLQKIKIQNKKKRFIEFLFYNTGK